MPPQPVTLAQVSVAAASVAFGVDAANNVYWYKPNSGIWTQTPITGKQMKLVSIGSDLMFCGLDPNGAVWTYNVYYDNSTWIQMPAGPVSFLDLSCGLANIIWAVGTDYQYYKYTGSSWIQGAPGYGLRVSVASDGTVIGIGASFQTAPDGTIIGGSVSSCGVWQRTVNDPPGTNWTQMDPSTLAQLSCGSATNIWALDSAGNFLNSSLGKLTQAGLGTGKQVSTAPDGTVWSIGTNNQVSRLVNNAWTPLLV